MEKSVFNHKSYRRYISDKLDNSTRGIRSELAKTIGCHLAYISQVLKGNAHFTLEQAAGVCRFFGLDTAETDFFILLVSLERSGTSDLKNYYQKKINEILKERALVKSRVKTDKALSLEDEIKYYSSWIFIAIDVLTSISEFQTVENISKHLQIDREEVSRCLKYLVEIGVVKEKGGHYEVGTARMHLPSTSNLVSKHHTNWRIRAMNSLDLPRPDNIHFSTVYSFSKTDLDRLKEMILKLVEDMEPVILDSPAEIAYCFAFDFFEI